MAHKIRRGGVEYGPEAERPELDSAVHAYYVCSDTHRTYMVHLDQWTLVPVTYVAASDAARDALEFSTTLNEGDWCWVEGTHRYSFWDGSQWRQIRY